MVIKNNFADFSALISEFSKRNKFRHFFQIFYFDQSEARSVQQF